MIPFWQGKSLSIDIIHKQLLEKELISDKGMLAALAPNIAIQTGTTEGHLSAGYEKLLQSGYNGIIEEADVYQKNLHADDDKFQEKYDFYESVKIIPIIFFSFVFNNKTREKIENRIRDIYIQNHCCPVNFFYYNITP